VKVILYVGGRLAARLDDGEQEEFLDLFRAAQGKAAEVRMELRRNRGR
jgi:hypothetical protein